jgi:hypothetical protein
MDRHRRGDRLVGHHAHDHALRRARGVPREALALDGDGVLDGLDRQAREQQDVGEVEAPLLSYRYSISLV